jgi:hypothetical protein
MVAEGVGVPGMFAISIGNLLSKKVGGKQAKNERDGFEEALVGHDFWFFK